MTFGSVIYNVFIGPLELFFEAVFTLAFRLVENHGLSIIFLSLAMNFLVLPLYRQADKMQASQRDIENALAPGVKHIKKTFKGDEQYMILQTYYRQNGYKPTDALKGSVSLLLEIPFFIAAYHFLSHLTALSGIPFGPIKDLGAPDALLHIGGLTLNLLPILMTLINFISSAIYLKGFPIKSKVQLYGIAIIFLVFLYKSPAGLVFYWTLNNLFSLFKNIAYKIKWPTIKRKHQREYKESGKSLFYFAAISLCILFGLLIPSAVIASSPAEFINMATLKNPLTYLVGSLSLSIGLFIVWFSVFRMLAGDNGKKLMGFLVWALSIMGLINYMAFGKGLGTISSTLMFETPPAADIRKTLINLVILAAAAAVLYIIWTKKYEVAKFSALVISIALLFMSVQNMVQINRVATDTISQLKVATERVAKLPLSKKGKNVVLIMMDRATSAYIPFILNEDKALNEQFSGFTYYPNTASFGAHTIFGAPPIWGGYEYTPEEMDKRTGELLKDKYDESLRVLPTMFGNEGYSVAVCDPTLAGYGWIPDLSIYDDLENTEAYITIGNNAIENMELYASIDKSLNRNFFCYSLFKTSPLLLQPLLYNDGLYNAASIANLSNEATDQLNKEKQNNQNNNDNQTNNNNKNQTNNNQNTQSTQTEALDTDITSQVLDGLTKATGVNSQYLDNLSVMENLDKMTEMSDKPGFIMLTNELAHRPTLLQEPGYTFEDSVDNSALYKDGKIVKTDAEGNRITLETARQVTNYHVNMATMKYLGAWFDYLRANGLYDNTKIIICSDHGWCLEQYKDRIIGGKILGEEHSNANDTMYYNALLLVKDFGAEGAPQTDNTFMTNADAPIFAVKGTLNSTINPYTKKDLTKQADKSEIHISGNHKWEVEENDGTTYTPSTYFYVHDNIFDLNNWKVVKAQG
ncbi:MAG: membrane protein insertase YidC, partial [Clostridia bacterium]|nr:membrane protein insertase YidC [Clostridia bacterium]